MIHWAGSAGRRVVPVVIGAPAFLALHKETGMMDDMEEGQVWYVVAAVGWNNGRPHRLPAGAARSFGRQNPHVMPHGDGDKTSDYAHMCSGIRLYTARSRAAGLQVDAAEAYGDGWERVSR